MKAWLVSGLILAASLAAPSWAGVPPVPATPASIEALVYASPFTLAQGYEHTWRREAPFVSSGYLLVLRVAPALVYPRQVAEPVLYVGNQTAERVNVGYNSGHVVAIVPGPVDLARDPIWFGTPRLPEQVDAATILAERAKAEAAGIGPQTASARVSALRQKVDFADKRGLLREAGMLIQQYSADERDLADGLLLPR